MHLLYICVQYRHHNTIILIFNTVATCTSPKDRPLFKISKLINTEWKNVGSALQLNWNELSCIDSNHEKVEEKALQMLFKWREGTAHPCYCKLLSALRECKLFAAVKCLNEFLHIPYIKKETTV